MTPAPALQPPSYPGAYRIGPPDRPFSGTVALPGSKSITNRALLIAGMARGETLLDNALYCDDSLHLSKALRQLGVTVEEDPKGSRFAVVGAGGLFPVQTADFSLGNAGTTTRFLTAALALSQGRYSVDGDARMRERPIGDLVKALRALGCSIDAPSGCPPIHIQPANLGASAGKRTPFPGGHVTVSGRTSSQFISALLLAAPLTRDGIEVLVEGELVSRPYIDVTLEVIRRFGADAWADDGRADGRASFSARAGRGYRGCLFRVEGDASTASYFMAAAALGGGTVRVEGLGRESIQGDARFADVLARMGAHVKKESGAITVTAAEILRGVDEDCRDIPDVVPTLAAVALFAKGRTRLTHVEHLRFKESDRIKSVAAALRQLGGRVFELNDGLEIEESRPRAGTVDTFGDHRIAMTAAMVGLRIPGVVVKEPHVVAKSFPEYFETLKQLGASIEALSTTS